MKRNNILCDVDGVVAAFENYLLEYMNNKHPGRNFTIQDLKVDFRDWPEWTDIDEEHFRGIGIVSKLKPISGATKFIEDLRARNLDVIFTTSPYKGSPTWAYEREKWLMEHFGAKRGEVIFAATGHKRYVSGITLIDDHFKNTTTWSAHNYGASSIMINQPWNEDFRNNTELHNSFVWGARKIQHLVGKKEKYSINCANNYDDVLFILKELGLSQI